MEWLSLFVYYLRERDMHLHIVGLNTEFTLHDRSQLVTFWIHAAYAELDWESTTKRLQTASARQLLDAGKGWSNSGAYGFTRDAAATWLSMTRRGRPSISSTCSAARR